jgi:hypothetical protein
MVLPTGTGGTGTPVLVGRGWRGVVGCSIEVQNMMAAYGAPMIPLFVSVSQLGWGAIGGFGGDYLFCRKRIIIFHEAIDIQVISQNVEVNLGFIGMQRI